MTLLTFHDHQGKRSLHSKSNQNEPAEKPSINLFHEELECEDFLFRTVVDD
jgi:hypothetical protein